MRNKFPDLNMGLYRDDGLAEHRRIGGKKMETIRQGLHDLFKEHGLKITINPPNKVIVHFRDVTLNLEKGTFSPYRKPNDHPLHPQGFKPPAQRDQRNAQLHQQTSVRPLKHQRGI